VRNLRYLLAVIACTGLLLAGCGGGGGGMGGSSGTSSGGSSSGGSSGGSSSGGSSSGPSGPNVTAVTVDGGPAGLPQPSVNMLYATVKVCVPGTATCQTIDHIQVDTGSYGLRLLAGALTNPGAFTVENEMSTGKPIGECTIFADGYSWGPVVNVDMTVGGDMTMGNAESASNIPVQIIGGFMSGTVPPDCITDAPVNNEEDTIAVFGANGILGVGPFAQDCGQYCTDNSQPQSGNYYVCTTPVNSSGSCTAHTVGLTQQVINPVSAFATDNTGVVIQMAAVPAAGSATATGYLLFGINTQSNNQMPNSATVLTLLPNTLMIGSNLVYSGSMTVMYKGTSLPNSFIDSGSNGNFFTDASFTECAQNSDAPGFYCSSEPNLSATNQAVDMNDDTTGVNSTQTFSVTDATSLLSNNNFNAFSTLAGTNSDSTSFDWGLPFFYGKTVYTAIDGAAVGNATGPFFAY